MPSFENVAYYNTESLKLTNGLLDFFQKSQELRVEYLKKQEKYCQEFIQLTVPRHTEPGREDSEKEAAKARVLRMLLATGFWSSVSKFVKGDVTSLVNEQSNWQSYLSQQIEPMTRELGTWFKDMERVSCH